MKQTLLYRFNDYSKKGDVVMLRVLTEEEEKAIDENEKFIFFKDNTQVTIPFHNIYFYGEINVDDDTDCRIITKKNLVDDTLTHSWIPTNFNYSTGYADVNSFAPTDNAVKWFKFCHCRIGKPKRVIAYKINCMLT